MGLRHQQTGEPDANDEQVLLASRLELVQGSLETDTHEDMPSSMRLRTHRHLDVISLRIAAAAAGPAREACWNWLIQAASTLKHRRNHDQGFETDPRSTSPAAASAAQIHQRRLQHAVPARRPAEVGGGPCPSTTHS
jgi:hypothetical protein